VERLPTGRHSRIRSLGTGRRAITRRTRRTAILAGAAVLAGLALPSVAGATSTTGTPTSLDALVAKATKLSNEIDSLSEQYDGLKIQLAQARSEAKLASDTALRDHRALAAGKLQVSQIAAQGYMSGGIDPSLQLLQSRDPQAVLNRASILQQLQQENGNKVNLLAEAVAAARRAKLTAIQAQAQAKKLAAEMSKKVVQIQAKENLLNSAAYSQAMAIFQRTGSYPSLNIPGRGIGVQALRWALSAIGKPYIWGAAGPDAFDCSGLVMWAYEHVGISLNHFTGDQWNEGEHISRDQLAPGDLVFFFADISHVGMYIGNGMMVDAPSFGQDVQVQPVFWSAFVGAVRIVA
jgi:cell wall-associated NlpC family hydrolase